jgi:hypothetical protein
MEDQEPTLPAEDVGDRISHLPDGVLEDIISLLPTKEGACTQVLASRWRHLWRSAPLNLDHRWLCGGVDDLDAIVSRILSAHPGPGRRFCAPVYHLHGDRAATADAWLRSPALDYLQELELCGKYSRPRLPFAPGRPQPPPAAAFRFSETLRVATIADCHLPDSTAQVIHLPKLQKLELERVSISESSLHTIIANCLLWSACWSRIAMASAVSESTPSALEAYVLELMFMTCLRNSSLRMPLVLNGCSKLFQDTCIHPSSPHLNWRP